MDIIFKIVLILVLIPMHLSALTVQKYEQTPKTSSMVKSLVNKITRKHIKKDLKELLAKSAPGRMVGTLGHKNAFEYITSKIREYDIRDSSLVSIQKFSPDIAAVKDFYKKDFDKQIVDNLSPKTNSYKIWNTFTQSVLKSLDDLKDVKGKNIIWEKKGSERPEEFIILGVHYDTIAFDQKTMKVRLDNQTPGADDNGSGVIIAMNIIKLLSAINIKRSVRIIFFDFQELGFNGSKAYVKKYYSVDSKEQWSGYINIEMLGHDSTILDKIKKSGNMKLYIRNKGSVGYKKDFAFAQAIVAAGKKTTSVVKFMITPNNFNMSDHINFWPLDIPVVALTQDWENDLNPRHHSKNDFFETLNFSTLHANYKYISSVVISWARMLEVK